MTPPLREVLALINIIEAESDPEERGILIRAARTIVRRLGTGTHDGLRPIDGVPTTSAMTLLEALLDERCTKRSLPRPAARSNVGEKYYA